MPRITPVRAAQAARGAGFRADQVPVMVAIAIGESGLNTDAVNRNRNGSTDYGLWQINTIHGYGELSDGSWRDPDVNARLAKRVFDKQGYGAWVVFNRGTYAQFLGRAQEAAGSVADVPETIAGGATDAVASIAGSAAAIGDAARDISVVSEWLTQPESWARIGRVALGGVLIGLGVWIAAQRILAPIAEGAIKIVGAGAKKAATKGVG